MPILNQKFSSSDWYSLIIFYIWTIFSRVKNTLIFEAKFDDNIIAKNFHNLFQWKIKSKLNYLYHLIVVCLIAKIFFMLS